MNQWISNCRNTSLNWNHFWFLKNDSTAIFWTRTSIAVVSLIVFGLYALQANDWYGAQGWIDPAAGLQMIGDGVPGTGAEYRASPFYANPDWMLAASLIGIGASICLITGRFGRYAAIIAFIVLLTLQSRAPLFLERGEPLLLASLLYLALTPSYPLERLRTLAQPSPIQAEHWLANLAKRLIQVHFAIWIAFSLASMLGYEGWWTGEAVRQLVEDRQGWLPDAFAKLMVIEFIAHAVIGLQIALLLAILTPTLRFTGPVVLSIYMAVIMLVLGDWLYCLILAATATSIWPILSQPLIPTSR